jgi:hypothetical protein
VKGLACLHCKRFATLNNHGRLKDKSGMLRGMRLWCCPRRKSRPGCGRTFCIRLGSVIAGHSVSAAKLAVFLRAWFRLEGNILAAWQSACTGFSTDSAYRWAKRFVGNQDEIRTRLCRVRAPPRPLTPWVHADLFAHLDLVLGMETFTEAFQIRFQQPWPMKA